MSVKESKSTQELLARIRDLEIENMELKSKLDQYQSVFPATGGPPIGGGPGASPQPAAPTERKVDAADASIREMNYVPSQFDSLTSDTLPIFSKYRVGNGVKTSR